MDQGIGAPWIEIVAGRRRARRSAATPPSRPRTIRLIAEPLNRKGHPSGTVSCSAIKQIGDVGDAEEVDDRCHVRLGLCLAGPIEPGAGRDHAGRQREMPARGGAGDVNRASKL
jgi:hypothetical protein